MATVQDLLSLKQHTHSSSVKIGDVFCIQQPLGNAPVGLSRQGLCWTVLAFAGMMSNIQSTSNATTSSNNMRDQACSLPMPFPTFIAIPFIA